VSPAHPTTTALGALSSYLAGELPVDGLLRQVSERTVETIPGATSATVSVERRGRPTTAAATDAPAVTVDERQYRSGAGPCLEAWHEQHVVRLEDVAGAVDRFPAFARAAGDHGVGSVLSTPLRSPAGGVGSLNVYGGVARAFSGDDEALAMSLAAVAAVTDAHAAAADLGAQLEEAMRSRAVIEQAKGILIATSPELGPEDGFALMRSASQRENVKLRVIAERIVERRGIAAGGETAGGHRRRHGGRSGGPAA
jgi:GAF domain-containing protein